MPLAGLRVGDVVMPASSAAAEWVSWLGRAQAQARIEAAWTACPSDHAPYLCMARALQAAAPYLSADHVARREGALSECLGALRAAARSRDLIILSACTAAALGMLALAFCTQRRRRPDRQEALVPPEAAPLGGRALGAPADYSCCRNCDGDEPIDLEPLRSYPLASLRLLPSGHCISARNAAALRSARDPTTNLELFPPVCAS